LLWKTTKPGFDTKTDAEQTVIRKFKSESKRKERENRGTIRERREKNLGRGRENDFLNNFIPSSKCASIGVQNMLK